MSLVVHLGKVYVVEDMREITCSSCGHRLHGLDNCTGIDYGANGCEPFKCFCEKDSTEQLASLKVMAQEPRP